MNIKSDSRKIEKGDTFIALNYIHDGHDYIEDAIKNGAERIIAEHGLYSVDTLIVNNTHDYLVEYLDDNYGNILNNLKIIGMTGTNGKTTTCFLIHKALNNLGEKCAYIGTIGFYIEEKIKDLNNTTPDVLELYEMLIYAYEHKCTYVVMEVSSHALALNRVGNIKFDYALFSNLTRDHLDYHETMEKYLSEKKKLFSMLKNEKKAIINVDSPYYKNFCLETNQNILYGFNDGKYKVSDYKTSLDGSTFYVNDVKYSTELIGKHNIYNLLCLISLLKEMGYDEDLIVTEVEKLECPRGRMEKIKCNDNLIIIDYAHTPDAVSNLIDSVIDLNSNHIYTIIGCGGNRDKKKRPIMADIATKKSDYVIFTSDNPRFENPKDIIDDMIEGLDKTNYEIEINRVKAIIRGIQLLNKNDILLVLGKGHETYQIIGNQKIDMDDRKIVLDNM